MKNYKIPIKWECKTVLEIEAESLEKAVESAKQIKNPEGKVVSTINLDIIDINSLNRNFDDKRSDI